MIPLCEHCGSDVPEDGMTYCGKSCAALGPNTEYAHLFRITRAQYKSMTKEQLKEWNDTWRKAMCSRHFSQFRNTCGYCAAEKKK